MWLCLGTSWLVSGLISGNFSFRVFFSEELLFWSPVAVLGRGQPLVCQALNILKRARLASSTQGMLDSRFSSSTSSEKDFAVMYINTFSEHKFSASRLLSPELSKLWSSYSILAVKTLPTFSQCTKSLKGKLPKMLLSTWLACLGVNILWKLKFLLLILVSKLTFGGIFPAGFYLENCLVHTCSLWLISTDYQYVVLAKVKVKSYFPFLTTKNWKEIKYLMQRGQTPDQVGCIKCYKKHKYSKYQISWSGWLHGPWHASGAGAGGRGQPDPVDPSQERLHPVRVQVAEILWTKTKN